MKSFFRTIVLSLLGVVAFGLTSCDDKSKDNGPSTISAMPGALGFTYRGGTRTVAVESPTEWEVTGHDEWIEAEKIADNRLQISVQTTGKERDGRIVVRNEVGDTDVISISQSAIGPNDLIIDPLRLDIAGEGETRTVGVYTLEEWDATTEEDWIEISDKTGDKFTVTVGSTEKAREGTITISCGNRIETIPIEQKASTLGRHFARVGLAEYAGDYYGVGVDCFFLAFETEDYRVSSSGTPLSGSGISLDVLAPAPEDPDNPKLAAGTYEIDRMAPRPFSLVASNYTFVVLTDPEAALFKITGGSMTVEVDDKGDYRIVFDVLLSNGEQFRGWYDGPVEFDINLS